jgi:hypothetical protein
MPPTPTFYVVEAYHKSEQLGLHHLSTFDSILPWLGGFGRMSEKRCQSARIIFASEAQAIEAVRPFIRRDFLWNLIITPLKGDVGTVASPAMPPKVKTPQTWQEQIAPWSPAEIIARLGCPAATAYSWTRANSPRHPPAWLQPILLTYLSGHSPSRK